MNVLYVNHTATVSGGERSLLALLGALPGEVRPLLATPPGELMERARELGVPTTEIRGTAGSLRLHPRHTPQAIAEMSFAGLQVARAARRHRADVLHANSIRAGLVLALARPAPGARIVHVRDVLPAGAVTTATLRAIAAGTTVVANSRYTAERLRTVAPGARLEVVHNPVDLARFDPARLDRAAARAALGEAGARGLLLGVVAQLTPWKGQDTAVRALAILRERGLDAHLLLIGAAKFVSAATRFDNEAYVEALREEVERAGLGDRVSWLGQREDVPELMRALDILLLPSSEEPFGRALIEAMALGVPVLATRVGGPPEIVTDGREGYLVQPGDAAAWAEAVLRIAESPDRGAAMGAAGRERARSFAADRHAGALLDLYRRAAA
ncbi:MAG TPA: glycosyltransferase family 4 protein [Solirubrobacteraceae bacterium]|jgi:glycosyltransferase involved in cell wall biosynthesis|nr:glycosyltransferase family 4 protein [Solirubrobacteraceae bacterium]